jgi:regulator of sigma E protease
MSFYWLLIIPILGAVVTIHELGHYFAARWLGIRVLEFGVGLPPRLFCVRRREIDYSLNWVPAGGFVKILGENGDSTEPDSFCCAPAWKRIIILAAGPLMNAVLALVIFALLAFAGVREVSAPLTGVGSVTRGEPASLGGMMPGDHILSINAQAVSSSEEIHALSYENAGKPTQFVVERDGQPVTLTVTPKSSQPYLGIFFQYWVSPVKAVNLEPGSPAERAGLKAGDEVIKLNDTPVNNLPLLVNLIDNSPRPISLTVRRDGREAGPFTLDTQSGVQKSSLLRLFRPYSVAHHNPISAFNESVANTADVIVHVPSLIIQAFTRDSKNFHLAGPLGLTQLVGEVAQENGINGLLRFAAMLSVSLFLINLVPLPALDGGRLFFILVEFARGGRRLTPQREQTIQFIFSSMLILFIVFITVFDAVRMMRGGRMLR